MSTRCNTARRLTGCQHPTRSPATRSLPPAGTDHPGDSGIGLTVGVLNSWRGVPVALTILVAFAVGFDLMLRRTRFGRGIIAIGSNVEAARRAGIPVHRIRITVFALGSAMAAIGGILSVSREFAAHQSTGGSDVLLFAIAAAVIGGVSLFGGRGSTYGALLGIAVIGSINNGMLLLELDSSARFMITAVVLLLAVVIDSLSRRDRSSPATSDQTGAVVGSGRTWLR